MGNLSVSERKPINLEETRQEEDCEVYTIIIVGDSSVGKSCLIIRYVDNIYTDSYINTIGIEFKIKTIIINGIKRKLQIIDTSGQKQLPIGAWLYKKAHGWVIMYDITDRVSFSHINLWLEQIEQFGDHEHTVKYIVGNKCDLDDRRVVSTDEGKAFATAHQLEFFETSAKTSTGVSECFMCMGSDIFTKDKV